MRIHTPPPVEAYEKAAREYCKLLGVTPEAWPLHARALRERDMQNHALNMHPPIWPPAIWSEPEQETPA